jgi:hypothetical protein
MPKEEIDFSNTIIYKIYCKNINIIETYIGHTTNFTKRKYHHKKECNMLNDNLKIYSIIRANGGWDNWDMVEISKCNCKNKSEARIKQNEYYEQHKQSLNKLIDVENHKLNNQVTEVTEIQQISSSLFHCKICDYLTSKIGNYDEHLLTDKHKRRQKGDKGDTKTSIFVCENCNKQYTSRNGLWKHKKICNNIKKCQIKQNSENEKLKITDDNLILLLINQCKELRDENKELIEIIKSGTHNTTNSHNTNSNNKTFNLQFFLNETCKDAMNIMDFVDSIKLQLSDLENVGKVGYVEGISNIITSNLKALDVTQRPVHCTDKKREVLYIKDENKWEKEDQEMKKMRRVIKRVASKNQRLLPKFKEAHPDCIKAASIFSDQYNKIIVESMGGSGENDIEKEDKIIKNIAKNVTLDKII